MTRTTFLLDLVCEWRAHGYHDEASRLATRTVRRYRELPSDTANRPSSRYALARALDLAGDPNGAKALLTALVAQVPDNVDFKGALGVFERPYEGSRRPMRIAEDLQALNRPFLFGSHTYWRACIAAALGEKDEAVELLPESSAEGRRYSIQTNRDSYLDPLRGYAPYDDLIRPKGRSS